MILLGNPRPSPAAPAKPHTGSSQTGGIRLGRSGNAGGAASWAPVQAADVRASASGKG
jgi:hypothetical protein